MSVDWRTATIGALIDEGVILLHKDGNHGSNYPRAQEFGIEGVPFLTAKLLDDAGNIDLLNAPRLAFEKAEKFKFGFIETDDVLLSHNATVGRVAVVPNLSERVLIGTSLTHFRIDKSRLLTRYLAAYFSGREFQNQLAAVMSQTTRNQVPITSQRNLSVVIPPINEQESIANLLGSFDNKIELNRRINQTLEEMAQAIFKSWFVDFEPVKAKIEAKANGQDPERAAMCAISGKNDAELDHLPPDQLAKLRTTAAHFPDELTDSELGPIPKGWKIVPFSTLARLDTTSVKPHRDPEKVWEHYSIPAYDESEAPILEKGEKIKSNKYKVQPSSILVSKLNPHFPRIWWPAVEDAESSICSTEFMQFVPTEFAHRAFIYAQILSYPFQQGILQRVTGTTGSRQRAQPKSVAEMAVIEPGKALISSYASFSENQLVQKSSNIKENKILAQLRDTVLPKLLSGEISVGSAQAVIEEVV